MRSTRTLGRLLALAAGLMMSAAGCHRAATAIADERPAKGEAVKIHYLEIVTRDVERIRALYAQILEFGPLDPGLGGSRLAR